MKNIEFNLSIDQNDIENIISDTIECDGVIVQLKSDKVDEPNFNKHHPLYSIEFQELALLISISVNFVFANILLLAKSLIHKKGEIMINGTALSLSKFENADELAMFISQITNLPPKMPIIDKNNILEKVYDICLHYKSEIENHRAYEMLYDNNELKHERFAQHLFRTSLSGLFNLYSLDLSQETNSGAGAVDFKVSRGSDLKVNIELKYSNNTHLIDGYKKQLPTYNLAENTTKSIYIVIKVDEKDETKISKLLDLQKGTDNEIKIMVIDATIKKSASKK